MGTGLPAPPPATRPGLHLGDLNVDVVLSLPAWPSPGEEEHLRAWHWTPGGSAANAAVLLARWGMPVRLLARVGRDLWARALRTRLAAFPQLDLTLLQEDPEHPTGMVFVLVAPDGERAFLTARGANDHLTRPPQGLGTPAPAYLHVTGFSALAPGPRAVAEALMDAAVHAGLPVVLDIGTFPARTCRAVLTAWLERSTVVSLTRQEARDLLALPEAPDEALLDALQDRVPVVALRLGRQGAWLAWGNQRHRYPTLPVASVDTTGAGDAFTAGLLLGWRLGLSPRTAGWLAHLLGALATTVLGAGTALPGPDALRRAWPRLSPFLDPEDRQALAAGLGLGTSNSPSNPKALPGRMEAG